MLRIYCLQQWYGLSDLGVEEALYDIESMRRFRIPQDSLQGTRQQRGAGVFADGLGELVSSQEKPYWWPQDSCARNAPN
jgi:Transposase domain (DUF772)